MKSTSAISEMHKPLKSAVFIPTNLPLPEDPRDIGERSVARFRVGIEQARRLREQYGRANVIVVVFGGWPLYGRIPLSVQHVYAAVNLHNLLQLDEIDLISSYGLNSFTDLHGTLKWMTENILNIEDAYVVTSKGHAARLVAECDMHTLFSHVYHVESSEPRDEPGEDEQWVDRARTIAPHQYKLAARASDVWRNGSKDSMEWMHRTRQWAMDKPEEHARYVDEIWRLVEGLEENNVALRSQTPGGWRINLNC